MFRVSRSVYIAVLWIRIYFFRIRIGILGSAVNLNIESGSGSSSGTSINSGSYMDNSFVAIDLNVLSNW
jgi:hypothetical protein